MKTTKKVHHSVRATGIFLLLYIWLFAPVVNAQPVTWSPVIEHIRDSYIAKIVGEDAKGRLHILHAASEGQLHFSALKLERLKPSLERDFMIDLNLPRPNGIPHQFLNMHLWNNKLYVMTTSYDKKENQNKAWLNTLDEKGRFTGTPLLLDAIETTQLRNLGEFDVRLSADSSHMLISHYEPFALSEKENIFFKVLDKAHNTVWEKTISLPYMSRDFEEVNHHLAPNGDLLLLAKITRTKDAWTPGNPNFHYILFHFDPKTEQLIEYKIDLGKKSISNIAMAFKNDGNLIVAGCYSNVAKQAEDVAGSFYLTIDPTTKKIINKGLTPIAEDFLKQFLKKADDPVEEIHQVNPKRLLVYPDGSFDIITERSFMIPVCYTNQQTGFETCNDNFYFSDIILLRYDAAGNAMQPVRLEKEQVSINDNGYYSSFMVRRKGNNLQFLFNDHENNLDVRSGDKVRQMSNIRRSVPLLVTIDKEGRKTREMLALPTPDVLIRPVTHKHMGSRILIYGNVKRGYQYGRF